MSRPDLNLLFTLDALLAEGTVARAARRLRLSPSAMSRSLARLREATGDPLLVKAGRALVPTPRALELRAQVGQVVRDGEAMLRPADGLDVARLVRTFALRTREGFVETFGVALVTRVRAEAPGVRLRFVPKPDKDSGPLRDGSVDLETGVIDSTTGPEVRVRTLFRDRFVGVVRDGHALAHGLVTADRFAAGEHVVVSRRPSGRGQLDEALTALGLERRVATVVDSFAAALALVRASDWITCVPERPPAGLRDGLHAFVLPVELPPMTVSLLWHPRLDADPAHRWLRGLVVDVCAPPSPPATAPRTARQKRTRTLA